MSHRQTPKHTQDTQKEQSSHAHLPKVKQTISKRQHNCQQEPLLELQKNHNYPFYRGIVHQKSQVPWYKKPPREIKILAFSEASDYPSKGHDAPLLYAKANLWPCAFVMQSTHSGPTWPSHACTTSQDAWRRPIDLENTMNIRELKQKLPDLRDRKEYLGRCL